MADHIRSGGQVAAGGGAGARDGCGSCSCRQYLQNARFAGALRALCRALCQASCVRARNLGAVWARGRLHVGSSAARNSGPTCSSDVGHQCQLQILVAPLPFVRTCHRAGRHERRFDYPARTRTCQMAENARSSSAHVLSPQACQSAHGISRLPSPFAVGLLIAHFKPSANSGPRGWLQYHKFHSTDFHTNVPKFNFRGSRVRKPFSP